MLCCPYFWLQNSKAKELENSSGERKRDESINFSNLSSLCKISVEYLEMQYFSTQSYTLIICLFWREKKRESKKNESSNGSFFKLSSFGRFSLNNLGWPFSLLQFWNNSKSQSHAYILPSNFSITTSFVAIVFYCYSEVLL